MAIRCRWIVRPHYIGTLSTHDAIRPRRPNAQWRHISRTRFQCVAAQKSYSIRIQRNVNGICTAREATWPFSNVPITTTGISSSRNAWNKRKPSATMAAINGKIQHGINEIYAPQQLKLCFLFLIKKLKYINFVWNCILQIVSICKIQSQYPNDDRTDIVVWKQSHFYRKWNFHIRLGGAKIVQRFHCKSIAVALSNRLTSEKKGIKSCRSAIDRTRQSFFILFILFTWQRALLGWSHLLSAAFHCKLSVQCFLIACPW